ncbi:hypothetical protein IGI37_000521 [Enterococcus sp. AZ194]|uniref:hypothetical protein n=1 Tax=Enterococcus sp. AZ194 TaxID=2774629 RepID=UPI003F208D21
MSDEFSRMSNRQNAEQIASSISSAAADINRGNEDRAHERFVHELKMEMINATTDRQYRALEFMLQEENARWEQVLKKRKKALILTIISSVIAIVVMGIVALYVIGKNSNSYEPVHTQNANKQTEPIKKVLLVVVVLKKMCLMKPIL